MLRGLGVLLMDGIRGAIRGETYHGEFDPGSERTLAARFMHASRAARGLGRAQRRTGE